jgi:hypothetical protein
MNDKKFLEEINTFLQQEGLTSVRVKKIRNQWSAEGIIPKRLKGKWESFAGSRRIGSRVQYQVAKIINFEPEECERVERIASQMGLSFSSYLRLAEKWCGTQILRVWQDLLDFRAKEFVADKSGVHTKRYGISPNHGLNFINERLSSLCATYSDAHDAVFPSKPLRSDWVPVSFEGDSHEQWVAESLMNPDNEQQQVAIKELTGPLTDFFIQAVDRHRLALLNLVQTQARVVEKYTGGNLRQGQGLKRDLDFAEEGLRLIKSKIPLGYKRFRQWASQVPSLEFPQGRGYLRWSTEKEIILGGDAFYDELRHSPKPRLTTVLKHQLEQWRDYCREHLKALEKWLEQDKERLNRLQESDLWYDVDHLKRLLAQDQGKAANINRRPVDDVFRPMHLREVSSNS